MIGNPKIFQAVTAIRQSKSNYNCKPSIDQSDTILGIEIDNKLNFEKKVSSDSKYIKTARWFSTEIFSSHI